MHAFLIIGKNPKKVNQKVVGLAAQNTSNIVDFQLQKIAHLRDLQSVVKLSLAQPTTFVINSVDTATPETLNAFLKILEEPQKNVNFILTAESLYKILPTIVSRCTVITLSADNKSKKTDDFDTFMKLSPGSRLKALDNYKDRKAALAFIEQMIHGAHSKMLTQTHKSSFADILKTCQQTHLALAANGNVTLHMTNFVVQLEAKHSAI